MKNQLIPTDLTREDRGFVRTAKAAGLPQFTLNRRGLPHMPDWFETLEDRLWLHAELKFT